MNEAEALRVVQVCSSRSWGGMEMHVADLSVGLAERGHEVWVACHPRSPLATSVAESSVRLHPFRGGNYIAPLGTFRLARWLRQVRPHVVHVHYGKDLWLVVPALSGLDHVPLVFIKHIGTRHPKRDPIHRWLYGRVDYAVAISQVIARNLLRTHPLPPAKVGIIYHGVDVEAFQAARAAREEVRREFGFGSRDFVVGIMGRLEPHKGHLEFIAMAEKVAPRIPEARFLIVGGETVGEEDKAEAIRQRWKASPVRGRIVMAGFRQDVPRVLSAMDVFVFPSHAEAFGLVLIEAMAAGLPVVTSNCDGVLDVVEDGVSGWMVSPTDVEALAEKVLTLARDTSLRDRMSKAAVARARSRFSRSRMLDEVETLYRRMIAERCGLAA